MGTVRLPKTLVLTIDDFVSAQYGRYVGPMKAWNMFAALKSHMARPSLIPSLCTHLHTRRDRVASLTTCRLHGAPIQRASPLGPGRALTLPCGWNNAGGLPAHHRDQVRHFTRKTM